MVHNVKKYRFLKVGSDVLNHGEYAYLIIVDYMSDSIRLKILEDETAASVIEACKEIFARHGVLEIFQGNNAPYITTVHRFRSLQKTGTLYTPYHCPNTHRVMTKLNLP